MNQQYRSRVRTIEGFSEWTRRYVARGYEVYFINLMFKRLPRRLSFFLDPMEDEACRVYQTLVTRVVREPRKQRDLLPVHFGCPDFPVWKSGKIPPIHLSINDGRHWNGLYFIPPISRLLCDLDEHFEDNRKSYLKPDRPLQRIHTTQMTHGDMTDYTLKAFKHGRIEHDNILVLPRALSELDSRSDRKQKSL